MSAVELTEFLVKNLVKEADMVSVKQFDGEDDLIVIQVLVNESDMGSIIGRGGNIANAIRTLVQAASYASNQKKVKIDIDSF